MINIEIDGKKCEVEPGEMVIAAADAAGIYIPRFCYHKKLTVAANCRMCLVEVEKVGKPLPACATPVTEGMKVFTQSPRALDAQRSVMEFLLINHPLDCPICDQGGECELQDLSMGYGQDISRYNEGKRVVKDKDIGSLVATDMTRCIQCTRCVRFGQEIAGIRELGATGRGENMEIGTYVEHSLVSEISGNIIDLCPVGALTSKPFRFKARAWELNQFAGIAAHDCVGSNIYAHTYQKKVMRTVPRENETVNETWISDRDRFSYAGLYSNDRLQTPLIKKNGEWQETDWQTALNVVIHGLQHVIAEHGPQTIGALSSPNSTLEEHYLLQKLWRGLNSPHVDHRLRQMDTTDQNTVPLYPGIQFPIQSLEQQEIIILVGSNIQREQPLLGHRIRQATKKGAKVFCLNPVDYDFNFPVEKKIIVSPNEMCDRLADLVKQIPADKKGVILLGALAEQHPQASVLRTLAQNIAQSNNMAYGVLTEGANSAGAWLAGMIPHRLPGGGAVEKTGLSAYEMFVQPLKAYLLMGFEPELDCAHPKVKEILQQSDFVVALSPYKAEGLLECADVILPTAPFSETSGTFVNVAGTWQSFAAVSPPLGETRPGWKILRALGSLLELPGFDYVSSEDLREELKGLVGTQFVAPAQSFSAPLPVTSTQKKGITRIAEWPMYRTDSIVRRSLPLQNSAASEPLLIRLNEKLAKELNVSDGSWVCVEQENVSIELGTFIDNRIPDHCVYIPCGFPETAGLEAGTVNIKVKA